MLKRSQHDKTLGLETALTKKEGALEDALRESDDLARRLRTAEAEVERTTDSLSEALKREEALRKHSEAIGQVFQVRLLEIQGKYTAAHEAEAGLERELAQVREQRDQEIAAAAAMFKNIEQKALSEKQQATALQQALDYSARLEKEKAALEDRVATLNLQHISQKSRWAFASFRSDHLSRRVVELEGIKASLESQLRGAFDAADRALVGTGGGLRVGTKIETRCRWGSGRVGSCAKRRHTGWFHPSCLGARPKCGDSGDWGWIRRDRGYSVGCTTLVGQHWRRSGG